MLLYLLRHADAETPAPTDGARPLSEKGRAQAKKVARFCQVHEVKVARVLTSPLRRAHETAEPVAKALGVELAVAPWLASGLRPQVALDELRACRDEHHLMLVGHEPDFSHLVAHLLGLPANTSVIIRKASLTLLEVHAFRAGAATLQFTLPCKLM